MRSDQPDILSNLKNRVLTITFNRPSARNSINAEITAKLFEILTQASKDSAVGAIILTGLGKDFCAGGDIKGMASPSKAKREFTTEELLQMGAESALLLHQMPKPTIALIRGACAGGGLSYAAGCDLRYADFSAKFSFAYTQIGLSGDFAGNYLIQHWLGATKAREFCLLCSRIDAEEAQKIGLITGIVADNELENHAIAIAEQLANGPTGAIGRVKQNLNNAWELPSKEYINIEKNNFLHCRSSLEHKEAISAFIESRPTNFPR